MKRLAVLILFTLLLLSLVACNPSDSKTANMGESELGSNIIVNTEANTYQFISVFLFLAFTQQTPEKEIKFLFDISLIVETSLAVRRWNLAC